jgi:hypothetical protein
VYEYTGNLHVHTTYSDGAKPHSVVAAAAIKAGLDFLVFTDHNVWVGGVEGMYQNHSGGKVLVLTGEEVHNMMRKPQRNHLLVYGAGQELAAEAQDQPPQHLLDAVNAAGGIAFIAHPIDRTVNWAGEDTYSWVDWDISGYVGIELWNYMSAVKNMIRHNPVTGIRNIFTPRSAMVGPDPETLKLWDDLLMQGQRVAITGNADAHATVMTAGPLRKVVYPYEFLFRCVNTHVLLDTPLTEDWVADSAALYRAIAQGHAFVGYGIPGDPRGFRYEALREEEVTGIMGDSVALSDFDTLRIASPSPARLKLLLNGEVVAEREGDSLTYKPLVPGAYRVEAWKRYRRRERGWIFSNPIYIY